MTERSGSEIIAEIEKEIEEGTDLDGMVRVRVRSTRPQRAVFSVRLAAEETTQISAAAESKGVSMGDFIREAAMVAAQHELAAQEAGDINLVEMAQELDKLRERVGAALKAEARARASA